MTREEAIKTLSILKAAYPNSYKGMTKDEANGTVSVWATQFYSMPFDIVSIAVNKLISTNTFPPSINEVKQKIQSLYWEAWQMLEEHRQATEGLHLRYYDVLTKKDTEEVIYSGKKLDDKTVAMLKRIVEICEPMRTQERLEPSLSDLISGVNAYLTDGKGDTLKLKAK